MNPIVAEVQKPLLERQPWPWKFVKESSYPWQRKIGNQNEEVTTRYEAQKIQALEDQPKLIAEIQRLEAELEMAKQTIESNG
jgi:hypothetical protein